MYRLQGEKIMPCARGYYDKEYNRCMITNWYCTKCSVYWEKERKDVKNMRPNETLHKDMALGDNGNDTT